MNHRITIVSATAMTLLSLSAAPSFGRPVCDSEGRSCAQSVSAVTAPSTSPYAEPLEALGGLTLAQYLADHRVSDRRLSPR